MILRRLLLPFSWIYWLVTHCRNKLFDSGKMPSTSYDVPIISVGNITVGGTGKTPLTEYIISLLSDITPIALLSRGYGRKTKGVIIADENSTYEQIGDEPMQMKLKFPKLMVCVAEKRVDGANALLNLPNPPKIILLDDAFQHRHIKPGFSILVTDYYRPMWRDFVFPAGNLRESRRGIKRADAVLVSKCPKSLSTDEAKFIKKKLKLTSNQKLFFSSIEYEEPTSLTGNKRDFVEELSKNDYRLTAVAGIGNPKPFFNKAAKFSDKFKTVRFKDHHNFTERDIDKIKMASTDEYGNKSLILTTEKDAVRLSSLPFLDDDLAKRIWYIPILPKILFNKEDEFKNMINNYITEN